MTTQSIHVLTPQLANQIAAGEVIERPASVVKELLENAVDAGATKIQVELKKAGTSLIRITDNGVGIAKDELALALCRHATSKIGALNDLERITSLGFRGEALASICSVSKTCLISKPKNQQTAWQVDVAGEDMQPTISPASHPDGTCVEVKDLFYNTPARRRFLRSERTEYARIEELVSRIALSRFDVAITVKHDGKMVVNFPLAETEREQELRLKKIFGKSFLDACVHVDTQASGLKLSGWLSTADFSRNQSDLQYFYVNSRIVRDKIINHAIRQAYQDILFEGKHPAYALYLTLEPTMVDVNVHPTKYEVRFRESRLVHDFLLGRIRNCVTGDISQQQEHEVVQESIFAEQDSDISLKEPVINKVMPKINNTDQGNLAWPNLLRETPAQYTANRHVDFVPLPKVQQAETSIDKKPSNEKKHNFGNIIGMHQQHYLLTSHEEGLYIFDIKIMLAAQVYTQLMQQYEDNRIVSFPLLIPEVLNLSNKEMQKILSMSEALQQFGIVLSPLAENSLALRELPTALRACSMKQVFQALQMFCCELPAANVIEAADLFLPLSQQVTINDNISQTELNHLLYDVAQTDKNSLLKLFPNLFVCFNDNDLKKVFNAR